MEVTDANLQQLAGYLEKTLLPDVTERRGAEKLLESVEKNQNYSILLLHLMDKDDAPVHIRVSSAIMFKNFVKRNWRVIEDSADKIHEVDRTTIKQIIVGLMLKSPEQIQLQLSDAISIIGREDFPDKWPDLLNELIAKLDSGDFHIINGVLRTAHSLFRRYRHEFKSQGLWTEIKLVLDNFAAPVTKLFDATMTLAQTHASDPNALKVIFSSLTLICKIFYSLNFQDLPEYFEDNMAVWMTHFLTLLNSDNKLLKTDTDEEAGLLEQVKSQICDNVAMYAQKYDEEFAPHLPSFVTAVWNLLTSTGAEVKYDLLVSNAIQFLASVAERPSDKHLFEDPAALGQICEKIIVPNMQFRTADEETFEDNPEEYIRRDMEGSDVDTRRRAACDLVRALCKSYEGPVITNFSGYIQAMLQEYEKNPAQNWKNKDVAIFLVTSLAAKGQTQRHGATQTSELVNIMEFLQNQIVPILQSDVNMTPVLKADAIKFIIVFRSQFAKEVIVSLLPLLVNHLKATSPVVHTYSANCIEKLFVLKAPTGPTTLLTEADLQSYVEPLLTHLFHVLTIPASIENEYVMKAIMRTFSILKESIVPYMSTLVTQLTEKIIVVSKNPSKPHFNHYLFESLSIAIRVTCKANKEAVGNFEQGLFPPFQTILQQDVQEFIPYVFQLLSLLLELHDMSVPDAYLQMLPNLLLPPLWERLANIPPLVRLLQAFIEKGAAQIETEKISGLLGIFQKLLASKSNDHQGFYMLNSIVESFPPEKLSPYVKQIFMLLFQRLQSSKTTKYVKNLLVFFFVYTKVYGPTALITVVDEIQAKMFGMVLEKLIIAEVQKVSGKTERKICAVGITRLLTEAPSMYQGQYQSFWPNLLQAIVKLFELPEDDSVPDDEHFIEIEDTPGYQASYSQLVFCGQKETDCLKEVANAKIFLGQHLKNFNAQHPDQMNALTSGLHEDVAKCVKEYLAMQ